MAQNSQNKYNLKEIADDLECNHGEDIFKILTSGKEQRAKEFCCRNGKLTRLFDHSKHSSEIYYEKVKDKGANTIIDKPVIKDYNAGYSWFPINAYMKANNLLWKEAVISLGKDFGLISTDYEPSIYYQNSYSPKVVITEKEQIEGCIIIKDLQFCEFEGAYLDFWGKYGIGIDLLQSCKIQPIKSYDLINTETGAIQNKKTEIVYIFEVAKGVYKVYQPFERIQKNKWRWYTQIGCIKPNEVLFCENLLPEKCEKIFIVEGMKDALALNANFSEFGTWAVGLDNASVDISQEALARLKMRSNNLLLCLDNDPTGKKHNEKKASKYELAYLPYLPTFEGAKDIADLCANFEKFGGKEAIKNWLTSQDYVTTPPVSVTEAEREDKPNISKEYERKKIHFKPKNGELIIDYFKLLERLKELNFRRYDTGEIDESIYIQIQDNIIKHVGKTFMKEQLFEWLDDNHEFEPGASLETIKSKLLKGIGSYFADNVLCMIGTEPNLEFIKDTKNKAFFYFKNGIAEVTKEGIKLVPYKQMKGCIWQSQVLNREFYLLPETEAEKSVFAQFCNLISNSDIMNFECLKSIIGYNLHDFEARKRKAINFTDSSLEQGNNGRTGKTLLAKSLGKMRAYEEINGKDFKPDNNFKFQTLNVDTQIVNINDVKKGFKLEWLYNDITEGIRVEKKSLTPFRIQSNIIVCSNRPLEVEGGSDKDRVVEFEFSPYFSHKHSPEDEFKHRFFDDWSVTEWNLFDNFMLYCVQFYLKVGGALQPTNTNLAKRKLIEFTSSEFLEFIEVKEKEFVAGVEYEKKALLDEFNALYKESDIGEITSKKLTKWLDKYVSSSPKFEKIKHFQNKTTSKSVFVLTEYGKKQ